MKKQEKQYIITESQLKTVIKDVIKEQGLYGNTSDVVDYDLPEYLSDVIILSNLESMNDVENAVKELHKRLKKYKTSRSNREWFDYESLPSLPDWIYEQLNLDEVDNWWRE